MPFVLILVGLVLLVTAVRGTSRQFFNELSDDFTGSGNFIYWFLSLLGIGALGYFKTIRPVSDAFLILVITVLLLKNGTGFFGDRGFLYQIQNHSKIEGENLGAADTASKTLGGLEDVATGIFKPIDNLLCAGGVGKRIGIAACQGE